MSEAKCFASCVSLGQSYPVKLALLCQILQATNADADCSVQGLLDRSACWACLPPGFARIAKAQLLCNIAAAYLSEGGGGGGCVTPATPSNITGVFDLIHVNVSWSSVVDPDLDFRLYWGENAGGPYPNTVTFASSARSGEFQFGLAVNVFFYMEARNAADCVSAPSDEVQTTT